MDVKKVHVCERCKKEFTRDEELSWYIGVKRPNQDLKELHLCGSCINQFRVFMHYLQTDGIKHADLPNMLNDVDTIKYKCAMVADKELVETFDFALLSIIDHLGDLLKEMLDKSGVSIRAFGRAVGVSHTTIRRIYDHKYQQPLSDEVGKKFRDFFEDVRKIQEREGLRK